MAKFHINPETGNPGACRAGAGKCPFGSEAEHYPSKEAAAQAFEASAGEPLGSLKKASARMAVARSEALKNWRVREVPPAHDGTTFEEAWDKHFELLNQPPLAKVSVEDLLRQELDNPDFGRERGGLSLTVYNEETEEYEDVLPSDLTELEGKRFAASMHTRNGGGNKEHWHDDEEEGHEDCTACKHEKLTEHPDYLYDEEDEFDRTYTTYYFKVDPAKHDYASLTVAEQEYRQQDALARQLKGMLDGDTAPWAVMPVNPSTQKAYEEAWAAYREYTQKGAPSYYGAARTRPTEAHLKDLRAIEKAAAAGDRMPALEADWSKSMQSSLTAVDRYRRDREKAQDTLQGLRDAKTLHEQGKLPESVARALTGSKTFDEKIASTEKSIADYRSAAKRAYDSHLGREKQRVAEVVKHVKTVAKLRSEADRLSAARQWPGSPSTLPKRKS